MQLTTQDKIIAGILIVHSLLGCVWTYSVASQLGFPAPFLVSNLALATTGIVAGVGSFKRHLWAAILGVLFFAVQLLHVVTPNFQFSFTLGFNLNISLGWVGSAELGLNLFALAMLLWAGYRVSAPNNSFKPKPLRGSA